MKPIIRHGKWLGYVIYGIGLTTGLLYYRFPSNALKVYLVSEAAAARPPMVLSLKGLHPQWPPGIRLNGVEVSLREGPQQDLLQADTISIVPALWTLGSSAPRYHVHAHAYEGEIMGHVRLEEKAVGNPFSTDLEFRGLQIGLHPYIRSLWGRSVAGDLNGHIRYVGPRDRLMDGEGEGTLLISNGKVTLPQPILSLSAIDFDRFSATLSLKDRKVSLNHVQLEGKALKGELSGTITLNSNPWRSRLDLKGTVEPLGGLTEHLKGDAAALGFLRQGLKKLGRSFVIQGAMEKPTFKFL